MHEGDYVGAGTLLGYEGTTGRSSGFHVHFEIENAAGGGHPLEYIFPVYNPFYNKEKAEGESYNLSSDYMSMYRTVNMIGEKDGMKSAEALENITPERPIVTDVTKLIQRQGEMDRTYDALYDGFSLGWGNGDKVTSDYVSYLESKGLYDIYLEDAFFDKELAKKEGYLDIPPELLEALYGNIIVKTDVMGSLPPLTEEELRHILEYWLPAHYKEKGEAEWLMDNVFTDENIELMIKAQDEYKVSLVFAIAVAVDEQQLGLSYRRNHNHYLGMPGNYNIFSIKGEGPAGHIIYQHGKTWQKYYSYGNAFERFCRLIATNKGYYFTVDHITIASIGGDYCPGSASWINTVSKVAMEIMQYYTGSKWSSPYMPTNNGELVEIAKDGAEYLSRNGFTYGAGWNIPPYNEGAGGIWGAPKSRSMDCSQYMSWVIYEYGKAHNIPELINFGRLDTGAFESFCDKLSNGAKDGVYSHFQVIYSKKKEGRKSESYFKSLMEAGDFILYREGSAHHIEMLAETGKTWVYSAGAASHWKNPEGVHWTRRTGEITYIFRLIQ